VFITFLGHWGTDWNRKNKKGDFCEKKRKSSQPTNDPSNHNILNKNEKYIQNSHNKT
jgi:hypothetical protein